MTREEYLAIEAANSAEAKAKEEWELAKTLKALVSERYDYGMCTVDVTDIKKQLVMDMLDAHIADRKAAWDEAAASLSEELGSYDAVGPWAITVRLAPSLTDEVAAANNAKATVSLERNVIRIVADVEELEESTSSNPSQGTHKWIGLGIGTGLSSVALATYNGSQLTVEDGEEAASVGLDQAGEFVLYVRSDELCTVPKAIRLGAEGYPDAVLSIIVEQPED